MNDNENKLRFKVNSLQDIKTVLQSYKDDPYLNNMERKEKVDKLLSRTRIEKLHDGLTALITVGPVS